MRIGIFFVVDGVVLSDSVLLDMGQPYGDHIEHGGHYDYWLQLVPSGAVEAAFKGHAYDYYPRGRVVYDSVSMRAKLYADRCIGKTTLSTISEIFGLPQDARSSYDGHYQCQGCNRSFVDDMDEDDNSEYESSQEQKI